MWFWNKSSRHAKIQKTLNPLPISAPVSVPSSRMRKPKWEKALPKSYIVVAKEEKPTSLKLKVEIETTDTAEKKSITALLDSGVTGECINRDYAKSCQFNLINLTQPILVYNVDGSPNEAGLITEVVSLILHYKKHSEQTTFAITSLGRQKMILGHSWLCKHNPEIDWGTGEVKMSRCPLHCCSGCWDELCEERIAQKTEARRIDICSVGPLPEIDHDTADDIELNDSHSEHEPLSIEEGNSCAHQWMSKLHLLSCRDWQRLSRPTRKPWLQSQTTSKSSLLFKDLISEGVVVVYLDDILIFTRTLDKHGRC